MTIYVSKDVEHAIDAAVRSGQFASADEMVNELVRDYIRSHPMRPSSQPAHANYSEDTPDPLFGLMHDDAELMDEIVADAYCHRQADKWREFDL
jgi:Arc/MetJ-type ribon-helix-helix transcriptional regulator